MGFDFLDFGFPKSGSDWKSINGKPYITVSAKGRSNQLSNKINDGADFGPDTTLGATSPNQTGPPYSQTLGIKEAVSTGGYVIMTDMGYYDIYDEITPVTEDQNFILVGQGASALRGSGNILPPPENAGTFIRQNTAGKNVININMPVQNLYLDNFMGIFTQTTTGHGFGVDPEDWLAANPPTSDNDLVMTQASTIGKLGMWNVDANHYGFRFANMSFGAQIGTIFGAGHGGYYQFHSYSPSTSYGFSFGNVTITGFKIWQMLDTTSTVNIVDYSSSFPSGETQQTSTNLIYSVSPIDILTASGTLTPYLVYFDPYSMLIYDGIALGDIQNITCTIQNSSNNPNTIQFIPWGSVGTNANLTISPNFMYFPTNPNVAIRIQSPLGVILNTNQSGSASNSPNLNLLAWNGSAPVGVNLSVDTSSNFRVQNSQSPYTTLFQSDVYGNITVGGKLISTNSLNTNAPQPTVDGITSGNFVWSQPFQGQSYKKFLAVFNSYVNDTTTNQTVTYPTPFITYPMITTNNTGLTVSSSPTTFTITAPNNTTPYSGWVIIEGY